MNWECVTGWLVRAGENSAFVLLCCRVRLGFYDFLSSSRSRAPLYKEARKLTEGFLSLHNYKNTIQTFNLVENLQRSLELYLRFLVEAKHTQSPPITFDFSIVALLAPP